MFNQLVLNRHIIYCFALVFVALAMLIYQLAQWDKKLKIGKEDKFSNTLLLEQKQSPQYLASKKTMQASTIGFTVLVVLIFVIAIFGHSHYERDGHFMFRLVEALLIATGIYGGFLIGSTRRRFESDYFFNALKNQSSKRQWVERKSSLSEQRLIKQLQALAALTQNPYRDKQDLDAIFKEYAQITAVTLNVERVSIWLFNADSTHLDCVHSYTLSNHAYKQQASLVLRDMPNYLKALSENRVIAVDDVQQHPFVQDLAGYFKANHISAILNSAIWMDGKTVGAVCIEHVRDTRNWTSDEKIFAGHIADLVRISLETQKRREAEKLLLERSIQLEEMVQSRTLSLQESNQRFSYVVQEVPIAILMLDRDGNIVELNNEASNASGYSRQEMLGMHFIKTVVAKESRPQAATMAARTLKGENFRRVELVLQNAAGEKYAYECSIGMTAKSASDGSGLMVAIAQNISEQKALQKSLINAREAAEAADRTKSMFVAAMSHELRTPLNSIIGFLGVVLQGVSGDLNPIQKNQLERAYQSSRHLLLLISDVLDVSKIEAGFLQLNTEKFELKPLLIELEHAVQHLLVGKKLKLHLACAAKLQVTTDRKRLYQALLNVLSNAVKYTEQGSIEMNAQIENSLLIVSCKDTGIGIAEADFPKLFQPFERAESVLKIKTTGTGLGLYLTHQIITQLLGGSINLQSKLGQGCTFTIIMPANTLCNNEKNI